MNYSPKDYKAAKTRRAIHANQVAFDTDPVARCHLLMRGIIQDKVLCRVLRILVRIQPNHTLLKYPARKTARVDHYQRSRKVSSPKSNPELTNGESIRRTLFTEAAEYAGMQLSRDECEALDLIKLWNVYHSQTDAEYVVVLGEWALALVRAWRDCGQNSARFLATHVKVAKSAKAPATKADGTPRRKKGEGGDAMNRVSVSLDTLTGYEVM